MFGDVAQLLANKQATVAIFAATFGVWFLSTAFNYILYRWRLSAYPLFNERNGLFSKEVVPITELHGSKSVVQKGFEKFKGKNIWRVNTTIGEILVLSPTYVEKFKYGEGFHPAGYTNREYPISAPGYEPFGVIKSVWRQRISDIIIHRISGSVAYNKHAISEELTNGLQRRWTDDTEWHEVCLLDTMAKIIAQTTQRLFTGPELCRNDEYLKRITGYIQLVGSEEGRSLMWWPSLIRPLVAHFHPASRQLQECIADIGELLAPVVKKRKDALAATRAEAARLGKKPPVPKDGIGWIDEKANGEPYDPAVAQLIFSVGSFHSSADFMSQMLVDLCRSPHLIEDLKAEAADILKDHTWTNAVFPKLRLMDSCMRESQRMKSLSQVFVKAEAQKNIVFDDGNIVPKGALFAVSGHWMHDPEHFPDPEKFDPYRHLKLADGAGGRTWFTSVSSEHLAWGYGKHACPGRFFASALSKMLLTHILFKYEFKLPEGGEPPGHEFEFTTKLLVRRRKDNGALNLDSFDSTDSFDGWAEKEDWEEAADKFDGAL